MRANFLSCPLKKIHQAVLERPATLLSCLVLSLVLLGSGCRTYGARGGTEAAYHQIEQAVEQFTLELERAQSAYEALRQQTGDSEVADTLAKRYASLLEQHKVMLLEQRMQLEELRGSDDYRAVSRTLSAVMSEQDIMMDQYQNLLATVQRVADPALDQASPGSHYFVTPPFYRNPQHESLQQSGRAPAGAGAVPSDSAGASSAAPDSGGTLQP